MPDISMCKGGNCPHKEKCYRFMAKPSYYQTYFAEPPNKGDKCDYYWGENAQSIWVREKDLCPIHSITLNDDGICNICMEQSNK